MGKMVQATGKTELGECMDAVRKKTPLIHNITNYVTVNDVANMVLACGASPIMAAAAKWIGETYHCAVLCKGGHRVSDANDLLYWEGNCRWFRGKRIDNPNTHGTGCTLSSAIAANLAKGFDLPESVERAKDYISGALSDMLDLGKGSGPMNHGFAIRSKYSDIF